MTGNKYLFCKECIDFAPADPGVYALYDKDGEVLFYGYTEEDQTIQSRLTAHFTGWHPGTASLAVTHYRREVVKPPEDRPWPSGWDPPQLPKVKTPEQRRNELIAEFFKKHGRLPVGNKKKTEMKVTPPTRST